MNEERIIRTSDESVVSVTAHDTGAVSLRVSVDYAVSCLLTANEVREVCAALRMASEEAQSKLSTGPDFEKDEFIRVVAMSASDAQRFIGRDDSPADLGPAEATRYREEARVWGFKVKT